jgi:hypothetical protein
VRLARLAETGLLAGAVGYVAAQLVCTWRDQNRWPLCSYNMFNRRLPDRLAQPRVVLHDGVNEYPAEPVYGMMPLEFFRVVRIFAEVFLVNEDDAIKDRFAARVIDRLNTSPWDGFDEVRPSFRPRSGRFTGFDLYEVWIHTDDFDPRKGEPLHDTKLLYSYRSA